MKRALCPYLAATALALLAACTPNDKTITTDSTTDNAAAAADTAGAARMMAKDAAGVRMDSASTKSATGLGGPGSTGVGAATPGSSGQ